MNLFELQAKLGLDTSEFESGIEKSKSKFGSMKEVFAGSFLADFATRGVDFLAGMGREAIQIASDLTEVQNVVDVTFGDGAGKIDVWAKSAKNAFGMGELSAKKYAGTMGAMLQSMGMTDTETLEMSTSMVQLAGDMASFYNLDHETAFEKIRAGISGETEPLKQLGINMSVANLEAFALSQGIDKTYSSMTQAEQATLRYNYLLSATAGAQGDFARTAGSYSNQVKLFQQNVTSIMEQAGNVVIDIINPILQTINETLSSLTEETIEQKIADIEKTEQDELEKANLDYVRANALIDIIEELSQKTELSEQETKLWEASLRELVAIFPELASHIDFTNNTITTSTEALRENTAASWENAKEKAKIRALEKKEQLRTDALEAYADAQLDFDVKRAEADYYQQIWDDEVRRQQDSLDALIAEREAALKVYYGVDELTETQQFEAVNWARQHQYQANPEAEKNYERAVAAREAARDVLEEKQEDYETANAEFEKTADMMDSIITKTQAEADATKAAEEAQTSYNEALANEVKAFEEVEKAWDAVRKHREETYKQMRESLKNGTDDLWGVVADVTSIDVNKSMEIARENMLKNTAFYAEYAANLRAAQKAGLDEGLLAELAQNHTAENAAILEYVASGGDLTEVNAAWRNLQTAKDDLATTMTDTQLVVDEGYAALVDTAEAAVEQLNQYEEARLNSKETGTGVVDGLGEVIPDIEKRVEEINSIIGLVGSTPISLEFGMSASGSAGMIQSAVADGAREGVRSGLSGVRIPLEVRGLSSALAPGISYAIQQAAVQGRYNK